MDHHNRSQLNYFNTTTINRLSEKRSDKRWIAGQIENDKTRFLLVWRSRNLFSEKAKDPVYLKGKDITAMGYDISSSFLLGDQNGRFYFALFLPSDDSHVPERFSKYGEFFDLRNAIGNFDPDDASLLAYSKAIVLWHQRNRFCGTCGSPTRSEKSGHMIICTGKNCGKEIFPRTDPAVIVLVTHDDKCLLGRQSFWPKSVYSTIAGFVEPGESLESAVIREVQEETNIRAKNIYYHSSQPWPFPCSIMLGFTAEAENTDIIVDHSELEDARWFSRKDIVNGIADITFKRPGGYSIAFRLIEHWFNAGDQGQLKDII